MKRLSINFQVKRKKNSEFAQIYLRINVGGERKTIYLNREIESDNWNKVAQKPIQMNRNGHLLLEFLDSVKYRILEIQRELTSSKIEITANAFSKSAIEKIEKGGGKAVTI